MLVLSRKVGESISIADGIVIVKVVEIRGDKVRLGFEADREINIMRTELADSSDDESKEPPTQGE